MSIHSSEIDQFVSAARAANDDFGHPDLAGRFVPMDLRHDTVVDQSLDPFSDEYFAQQLALYGEIAGRDLDQASGELHPVEVEPLVAASNPTGIYGASIIAEHVRALSSLLALASLPGCPKVLDLGAGHGFSSEVFAYAGCSVRAIDIDPVYAEVALRRAADRRFDIARSIMNFDDAAGIPDAPYQAAFFYQSLHHCLRPWRLIADLSTKLDDEGVIGFTGEPMQSLWWKNWGLRLDHESVYVARRFGWFESGWSQKFIRECFIRNGYTLLFFSGGYAGSELAIASRSVKRTEEIRAKAAAMGLGELHVGEDVPASSYSTSVGEAGTLHGRPAFVQTTPREGMLLFGPYAHFEAGSYEFSIIVQYERREDKAIGAIGIDVAADFGRAILFREEMSAAAIKGEHLFVRKFDLACPIDKLEIRAGVGGDGLWSVSIPAIRRV